MLALRVRRFWCASSSCPRRTFAEQVPGLTRRHGQATERLRSALGAIDLDVTVTDVDYLDVDLGQ